MANVLNSDELRKVHIDGLDLVLVLSMLTIEIVIFPRKNGQG